MDLITYALLKKYIDDNKIDVSAIVNDFTTGGLDKVASAETVKILNEKITDLKFYLPDIANEDIYGVEVDIPNNNFTRLGNAAGKTAGADFDSVNAFGGRRRCIVADDRTILAYFGEDGYIETGSTEIDITINETLYPTGTHVQVMVYQPKFYYKRIPIQFEAIQDGIGFHLRKWRDFVSNTPKAGMELHPNFIRGGVEYDYILYPAYEGSIYDVSANSYLLADEQVADFNNDKLCSIANAKPVSGLTQALNIVNSRKLANNRGAGWQQVDVLANSAEIMLLSIEYATLDSQTAIGQGVVSITDDSASNLSLNTGLTSVLGNSSGAAEGVNGKTSISYRGRENSWGNIWKWQDGLNVECKGLHEAYWADSGFVSDIKTEPYKPCGVTLSKADGYISAIGYASECDFMYLPSETLGAANRPLNDYFYQNNAYNGFLVARSGGRWNSGSGAGACSLAVYGSSGTRYRYIGAGLLCIPKIEE